MLGVCRRIDGLMDLRLVMGGYGFGAIRNRIGVSILVFLGGVPMADRICG